MLAGIWLHERRQLEAMRGDRIRLDLRFPLGLEPIRAYAALDGLSGLSHAGELIAEVTGREGTIAHALWVPAAVRYLGYLNYDRHHAQPARLLMPTPPPFRMM